jgi:hypothetical protein
MVDVAPELKTAGQAEMVSVDAGVREVHRTSIDEGQRKEGGLVSVFDPQEMVCGPLESSFSGKPPGLHWVYL